MTSAKKANSLRHDIAPAYRLLCAVMTELLEDAATVASRGQSPNLSAKEAAAVARKLVAYARRIEATANSISAIVDLERRT